MQTMRVYLRHCIHIPPLNMKSGVRSIYRRSALLHSLICILRYTALHIQYDDLLMITGSWKCNPRRNNAEASGKLYSSESHSLLTHTWLLSINSTMRASRANIVIPIGNLCNNLKSCVRKKTPSEEINMDARRGKVSPDDIVPAAG